MKDALDRAAAHSPYLRLLLHRHRETTDQLASNQLAEALCVTIDPAMPVAAALRQAKGRLALAVAIGDLAGVLSLEQVMEHLSNFADFALEAACNAAVEAIVPGAKPCGFTAIALGKHGSRELNYSSDIDPILIFDPQTLPRRARDEPVESAVRIGRKLVDIMQARDEHGYVFRVDLRLRPSPEATPIVLPVDAAIHYYESTALTWERAAFIRARVSAGDVALGNMFLSSIGPFIWRRGLDFGVAKEVRGLSQRIRDHAEHEQDFGPGYSLKRGRGGIRDCEFFAQIHQLIHGGRNPELRVRATMPALVALSAAGWISPADADTASGAYRLLRTVEHRLQMVDDQQTHVLPLDPDALDNVAQLHGLPNGADLIALLAPHVASVGTLYDTLDRTTAQQLPQHSSSLRVALRGLGYGDAVALAARIQAWRRGKLRAVRSASAAEAMEAVLPQLLQSFAEAPDPLLVITRFEQILERLPTALNLFQLLDAQPQLRALLTQILCMAPMLAEDLTRRADLLDGLISADALDPLGSVESIIARLRHPDGGADLEARLDRVRQVVGELRFALGVQTVAATHDPLDIAAGYARLAEAAVVVITDATRATFEHAHGVIADTGLIALALGRFGGGSLSHRSDLDLVFMFSGDYRATSNGAKPLSAMHYYNRLAQRVISNLSVATAAGPLYEIDTRLRPSGAKGELCVSFAGFEKYQRNDAWTWEHMALTRARAIYGAYSARLAANAKIRDILMQPHDQATVLRDAIEMRHMIAENKPGGGEYDMKSGEGGLIDLEFCIHVQQLVRSSGFSPSLTEAMGALEFPRDLRAAHDLMTRFLVAQRLLAPDFELPDPARQRLMAQLCKSDNWAQLMAQLKSARTAVRQAWRRSRAGKF